MIVPILAAVFAMGIFVGLCMSAVHPSSPYGAALHAQVHAILYPYEHKWASETVDARARALGQAGHLFVQQAVQAIPLMIPM